MLNFALIGCGRIAKRHSDLLGFNKIPGARLVSVCDKDLSRAKVIGEKFEIPCYTDYHEMLTRENIDVVSILTPSGLHAEHALDIARYNKHVIVEKPMALCVEDADRMIKRYKEIGKMLFVVKQNRMNVPVKKMREQLEAGRFGKLVMGTIRVRWKRTEEYYAADKWRGTWAQDGGVLANQASHHIDLLQWMMGDVESVFAKSANALVQLETEDTAIAALKFKNGALGLIEATTATRPRDIEGSISVLGERGTVEIGGFAVNEMKIWDFVDNNETDSDVLDKFSVNPPDVYGFGHREYLEHVVKCINGEETSLIDGEEGKKSLELISAIYRSIETKKEVFLHKKPRSKKLGKK